MGHGNTIDALLAQVQQLMPACPERAWLFWDKVVATANEGVLSMGSDLDKMGSAIAKCMIDKNGACVTYKEWKLVRQTFCKLIMLEETAKDGSVAKQWMANGLQMKVNIQLRMYQNHP